MSDPKKRPSKTREASVEVLRPAVVISGPSLRAKALKAQADVLPDMVACLMQILDQEAELGRFQALVPISVLLPESPLDHAELGLAMTRELERLGCHSRVVEGTETKHGGLWEVRKVGVEVSWREPML